MCFKTLSTAAVTWRWIIRQDDCVCWHWTNPPSIYRGLL